MLSFSFMEQMFGQVFTSIRANKVRTFLTCLGIIIGIASVIGLMSMSKINTDAVKKQMDEYGMNLTFINLTNGEMPGFDEGDFEYFRNINDNVKSVSGEIYLSNTTVIYNGRSKKDVGASGYQAEYYRDQVSIKMLQGRKIDRMDEQADSYVCMLNSNLAGYLFQGENPIGKEIICYGMTFRVVGVYRDKSTDSGGNGEKYYCMMMPYGISQRISGVMYPRIAYVFLKDPIYGDSVDDAIKEYLAEHFPTENDPYIYDPKADLQNYYESQEKQKRSTLIITAISLLVGGIGIMNMMLVSVSERTKEIGLLKALGATPGVIQQQFLLESICLSLLGGFIGIVVGVGVTAFLCVTMDHPFFIPTTSIIVGMVFSTVVGVVFGWLPARSASLLNPIDALRND